MKKIEILGAIIGVVGISLAWIFFSWKLVLVILLVLIGNNMEQSQRYKN